MSRSKSYERKDVISKALELFRDKGYEASSLSELVEVTGLNKRILYSEFGSKEALFAEVLTLYIDRVKSNWSSILNQEPYGLDNIRAYFRQLAEFINHKGCLLTLTSNEKTIVSSLHYEQVQQAFECLEQSFEQNLRVEKDRQEAKALAKLLVTFMQGLASMSRLEQNVDDLKPAVCSLLSLLEKD